MQLGCPAYRLGRAFRTYVDMIRCAPGLQIQQDVFAAGLGDVGLPEAGQLDKFGLMIAQQPDYDGVYCIAGDRGSGKSSILNRVEWFCNQWLTKQDSKLELSRFGTRPVLVRIDVASHFDPLKFSTDLMRTTCQETRRHSRTEPVETNFRLATLTRVCGYLGRWCRANRGWAIAISILSAFVLFFNPFRPIPSYPFYSNLKEDLLLVGIWAGVPVAILGFIHNCRIRWVRLRSAPFKFKPGAPLGVVVPVLFALLATIILASTYFTLLYYDHKSKTTSNWPVEGVGDVSLEVNQVPRTITLSAVLALEVVWLAALGIAVASLPRWWHTLEWLAACEESLKRKDNQQNVGLEIPGLSGLTGLIHAVLPHASPTPDMSDADSPFRLQLFKELLRDIVAGFGSIVFVIDDVDVLPSACFSDLLRILRPITKVPGAKCVMAVPKYFVNAIESPQLNDVHSTVRRCLLVRRPAEASQSLEAFLDGESDPTVAQYKAAVDELIWPLVESRFKVPVDLNDFHKNHSKDLERVKDYVLGLWKKKDPSARTVSKADVKQLQYVFNSFRDSRREFLRETDRLLENPERFPFEDKSPKSAKEIIDQLIDGKAIYALSESALNFDRQAYPLPKVDEEKKIVNEILKTQPPR